MSDVKELDATSNWESAVDMDAAMIAAMRTPAMKLGNSCLAKVMNTIFCAPTVSSSSARNILPKYAIRQVQPSAQTTQMIATVALFFTIDGFSMDMNLTRICGMPKYPRPQERPVMISCQEASNTPLPKLHSTICPLAAS